jgi:ABC-type phosphate transport system permease subunit
MEVALLLFFITILVNSVARFLVWRVAKRGGRA